jgi:hypothetical protein
MSRLGETEATVGLLFWVEFVVSSSTPSFPILLFLCSASVSSCFGRFHFRFTGCFLRSLLFCRLQWVRGGLLVWVKGFCSFSRFRSGDGVSRFRFGYWLVCWVLNGCECGDVGGAEVAGGHCWWLVVVVFQI